MADSKISDMTALTAAATAQGDLFVVVDDSATANKKMTVAEVQKLTRVLTTPEQWLFSILGDNSIDLSTFDEVFFDESSMPTQDAMDGEPSESAALNVLYQLASGDNQRGYNISGGTSHMEILFAVNGIFDATDSQWRFGIADEQVFQGVFNEAVEVTFTRTIAGGLTRLTTYSGGIGTNTDPSGGARLMQLATGSDDMAFHGFAFYMNLDGENNTVVDLKMYIRNRDDWIGLPYSTITSHTAGLGVMGAINRFNIFRDIDAGTGDAAFRFPIGLWVKAVPA